MNKRYLLLIIALVVVALWLSGLLNSACQTVGRSASSCDGLTSVLVGLFVGGLVSFWASAQVAAASDRETRKGLNTLTDNLKNAVDEKLTNSTNALTANIDSRLQAATTALTSDVDKKLNTVSRDLTAQMQKDLEAVADGISAAPSKTASALEARQQASAAVAALPLLVKALPHLIKLITQSPDEKSEPPVTPEGNVPPASPGG